MAGILDGVRVLVTRPADQNQETLDAVAALGALPIAYPTVKVVPAGSFLALDAALARISEYAWVVFTSPSAVRFSLERPGALAALQTRPLAAVGRTTARSLSERGLAPTLVPSDERQEGLVAAFADLPSGARVLFPQAAQGRDLLREALAQKGCLVEVVPVSETVAIAPLAPLPAFEAVFFASPSAVRAFVASHGTSTIASAIVVAIGPTTAAAASHLGLHVDAVASRPSAQGLAAALASCYKNRH